MPQLRIALAQVNTTVGDIAGNAALTVEWTRKAAQAGAHVVAVARTQGALEELDDEIRARTGQSATLVPLDITDGDALDKLGFAIHQRFGRLDLEAAGLPSSLALRVGAHLGPVYAITDPVLGAPSFIGSHVSRTARIEPVTPEGSIYVTERFAAALQADLILPEDF